MARERNVQNLKTEKEGIIILKKKIANFQIPSSDERKYIYKILDIDYRKYSRSVDGIILNVPNVNDIKNEKDVTLVEIKTTKAKNIKKLPYGAFFGITQNEEDLFKAKSNFRLCIVHSITEDYAMIDYKEYNSLIQNKRVQYQVNFKSEK
jgi:hypothetical protein|tara:strand:- start:117 stop:566 length:450 start_codon:yes stop_codon:yes gene_type:complete